MDEYIEKKFDTMAERPYTVFQMLFKLFADVYMMTMVSITSGYEMGYPTLCEYTHALVFLLVYINRER